MEGFRGWQGESTEEKKEVEEEVEAQPEAEAEVAEEEKEDLKLEENLEEEGEDLIYPMKSCNTSGTCREPWIDAKGGWTKSSAKS